MRTLGIDLGTTSLGWCLIDTDGEPLEKQDGSILAIGARIFGNGREPKSGTSLAVDRRAARAMRRRRDRYLSRRAALLRTLTPNYILDVPEEVMPTDSRQAGTIEVTSEMAELGASVLREANLGCDLRELAIDIFNIMLAEANAHAKSASASTIRDL